MKQLFSLNVNLHNRVFGLDVLRALAILFVVISHGAHFLPTPFDSLSKLFVQDGVSMFFVLSGFLIGGILIKILEEKPTNRPFSLLFDFWLRRWLRTLPAYFFVLIVLILASVLFKPGFDLHGALRYFVFFQNFITPHPSFFGEAWSLSVEEWFYCILPICTVFFVCVCKQSPQKSLLYTICLFIISVTLFRYDRFLSVSLENLNDWDLLFRKQVITRLDCLMYGVLGAFLAFYYPEKWLQHKSIKFFMGLFLLGFDRYIAPDLFGTFGFYSAVLSFSVVSFAVLLLLPCLSTWKSYKGFLYKPVMYVSLCSYSMYLLNLSAIQGLFINRIPP